MFYKLLRRQLFCLILTIVLGSPMAYALTVPQAIEAIGDDLVGSQTSGTWLGEESFTGSIVAGLCQAYDLTTDASYRTAAQNGGNYIIGTSGGNYYGDGAYALARLTDITGDSSYANAAQSFYNGMNATQTQAYIAAFSLAGPSTATFYVSQHAVAADKVGATYAGLWRQGVMNYLATVSDDTADYPVMSLGVATWALAQTGPMDSTALPGGESYWSGVTLADLPGILEDHQVGSGPYAGSFYWLFDHSNGGGSSETSGYTEDTAYGVLGLVADDETGYAAQILAGRQALAGSIALDGTVPVHLWSGGTSYKVFGGEVLQALPEPSTLLLLGTGMITILRRHRRKENK